MAITDNIHSLLIPMWNESLLTPNTAVAELINFEEPTGESEVDWYLGEIHWRGMYIPVLNLDDNAPDISEIDSNARIAVFNSVSGNPEQPFVGVLVKGLPRLSHVVEEDISVDEEDEQILTRGIKIKVQLGQETVRVPDVAALEKMALSVMT